jgi:hypothetical protein
MLASIPADDMAQTMRVLAGENAVNAARHFTRCSYYRGDVALVTLWSRTIQALAGSSRAPARPAQLIAEKPTQSRLVRERDAFQGVRYEDVDAATLALEEPPAIVVKSVQDWAGERFGFSRAARAVAPTASFARAA